MRNSVINRITRQARKDRNIFMISGDAGYGVLDEYKSTFPDRFLNLGVAEQNMIGMASGLGLAGYKVFVYNIVPFVLYRCFEQVRNDICYQGVPVTLIGIGSGVTYSPQGVTHYSVEDIALARTMPNMTIISPADPLEALAAVEHAIKSKKPVYIRIAKSGEPMIHKGPVKDITVPIKVADGRTGVAVLFHGSVSTEVLAALEGMKRKPLVLSVPMLQPMNFDAVASHLKGIHTVITVEEHYKDGGLGTIMAEWIVREGLPVKLRKLGFDHEFIHVIRNTAGMREHYGFSSAAIRSAMDEAFEKNA